MKPVLFGFHLPLIGEVTFPAYFTLLTIGFAVATLVTYRESRKIKLDPQLIIDTNIWMVIWGIIGARVLHLVADGHFHDYVNLCLDPTKIKATDALVSYCTADQQCFPKESFLGFDCGYPYLCDLAGHACHPARDCFAALEAWRGGLAYYGGFIFATAFAMWFLRRHKMPAGRVSDLASPAISLGLFFGRMGCFFNGCCYGKQTISRLGFVFPKYSTAWQAQVDAGLISRTQAALPVHATELYESAACLAISAILYFVVRPNKRHDFDVLAWLLILYGFARSMIEIFRDDDRGVFLGAISTSQILSIPLVALGIFILYWTRRPRQNPAVPA